MTVNVVENSSNPELLSMFFLIPFEVQVKIILRPGSRGVTKMAPSQDFLYGLMRKNDSESFTSSFEAASPEIDNEIRDLVIEYP